MQEVKEELIITQGRKTGFGNRNYKYLKKLPIMQNNIRTKFALASPFLAHPPPPWPTFCPSESQKKKRNNEKKFSMGGSEAVAGWLAARTQNPYCVAGSHRGGDSPEEQTLDTAV